MHEATVSTAFGYICCIRHETAASRDVSSLFVCKALALKQPDASFHSFKRTPLCSPMCCWLAILARIRCRTQLLGAPETVCPVPSYCLGNASKRRKSSIRPGIARQIAEPGQSPKMPSCSKLPPLLLPFHSSRPRRTRGTALKKLLSLLSLIFSARYG